MWYFAYGSNLNERAVAEWCRHFGHSPPKLHRGRPAVLANYRLGFSVFSEYWSGGTADIVYDPGKSVSGALFDLTEAELRVLDCKVGRKLEAGDRESGTYRRMEVEVEPLDNAGRIRAITYQGTNAERYHIPPTRHYMELVIQGAYDFGLSMMWIAYLQSFSVQEGRQPRPPGHGDASPRL